MPADKATSLILSVLDAADTEKTYHIVVYNAHFINLPLSSFVSCKVMIYSSVLCNVFLC